MTPQPMIFEFIARLCNVDQFCRQPTVDDGLNASQGFRRGLRAPLSKVTSEHVITTEMHSCTAEGVHHATDISACHPGDGIEALTRLPGLAEPFVANRLRARAAATPAGRLLAAGNWAELQNAREIRGLPDRSDSDEGRHTKCASIEQRAALDEL
jgi:hypothetical protein